MNLFRDKISETIPKLQLCQAQGLGKEKEWTSKNRFRLVESNFSLM